MAAGRSPWVQAWAVVWLIAGHVSTCTVPMTCGLLRDISVGKDVHLFFQKETVVITRKMYWNLEYCLGTTAIWWFDCFFSLKICFYHCLTSRNSPVTSIIARLLQPNYYVRSWLVAAVKYRWLAFHCYGKRRRELWTRAWESENRTQRISWFFWLKRSSRIWTPTTRISLALPSMLFYWIVYTVHSSKIW